MTGRGMLSFMRQMADGTLGSFETRCLSTNNPGVVFPKSPTDMSKGYLNYLSVIKMILLFIW